MMIFCEKKEKLFCAFCYINKWNVFNLWWVSSHKFNSSYTKIATMPPRLPVMCFGSGKIGGEIIHCQPPSRSFSVYNLLSSQALFGVKIYNETVLSSLPSRDEMGKRRAARVNEYFRESRDEKREKRWIKTFNEIVFYCCSLLAHFRLEVCFPSHRTQPCFTLSRWRTGAMSRELSLSVTLNWSKLSEWDEISSS